MSANNICRTSVATPAARSLLSPSAMYVPPSLPGEVCPILRQPIVNTADSFSASHLLEAAPDMEDVSSWGYLLAEEDA